jgi:DNA-binding transcriptional LysR family regulator
MSMDWNEVAVFARVVEAGSFTKAAAALGVPKSTVSRRVSRLEQTLGVRLLQRTTRKLSLTDAGADYYDRVSRAFAWLEEASLQAQDQEGAPRGTLRVTAPPDLADLLGETLFHFHRTYPDIRVDLALTGRLVDLVGEGFDVAVRGGKLRDSSLVAKKIGEMSAFPVASPSYLAGRIAPKIPADLEHHAIVLFRPKDGQTEWQLEHPASGRRSRVTLSGALSSDDYSFIRAATVAGAGIGLLPYYHASKALDDGSLVRVLPGWEQRGASLYLVSPSGRHVPRKVQVFKEFVAERVMPRTVDGGNGATTKRPGPRPRGAGRKSRGPAAQG